MVPYSYVWSASSAGVWSVAANWTDSANHSHHAVPGSGDYAIFQPAGNDGVPGSTVSCTMDLSTEAVNRVEMTSGYTGTLTIPAGNTLTTSAYFLQYGTLAVLGTVSSGDYIDINGAVATTAPSAAGVLTATGSFYLRSGASITAAGAAPALTITSANFDDGGTINAGLNGSTGTLTIRGAFTQDPAAVTHVYSGASLIFDSRGVAADYPILEGTTYMGEATPGTGGASTISTDTQLAINGGALNVRGGNSSAPNTITGTGGGNVRIYNSGAVSLGTVTPATGSFLTMATGSMTVGALSSTPTGGTLNLLSASTISFPLAGTTVSTFTVTAGGVINMYGATISMAVPRVSALTLNTGGSGLAAGQLNSLSLASGVADVIIGSLSNDGTVAFGGSALHTLTISAATGGGDYTQSSTGTLSMRLRNGGTGHNDVLAVGDDRSLAGILTLTGLETLTANTWDIITTVDGISGNFTTFNWPDGAAWGAANLQTYSVTRP